MKTQNINQRTAKGQVSKMVLYSSAIIFSVALISLSASAQDFWKQISTTGTNEKVASMLADQNSETEINDAVYETINVEVSTQLNNSKESNFTSLPDFSKVEEALEYNPQEFVNAEMAIEKENLINDNTEMMEAELELQAEALTNESEYNAAKFVEDELRLENETWMNNEDFIDAAEAYTADGSEQEITKYAQKVINATETEPAINDETYYMIDENFFKTAEVLTANESELEVAKYAQKVITQNPMMIAIN